MTCYECHIYLVSPDLGLDKLYKAKAPNVNRFPNLAQIFNLVVGGGVIIKAPPVANYHPHD